MNASCIASSRCFSMGFSIMLTSFGPSYSSSSSCFSIMHHVYLYFMYASRLLLRLRWKITFLMCRMGTSELEEGVLGHHPCALGLHASPLYSSTLGNPSQ